MKKNLLSSRVLKVIPISEFIFWCLLSVDVVQRHECYLCYQVVICYNITAHWTQHQIPGISQAELTLSLGFWC